MSNNFSHFERLVEIMKRLRGPGGCPWDAEQTHDSLKRYLIEECYEVVEAIDNHDSVLLKEELGDLLLQPVFHSIIAEETGRFTIHDVVDAICTKLISRHPHVFGDLKIRDSAEQVENWERIKQREKSQQRTSALSGVPPHLPALLKAQKITEKAARIGFDWDQTDQVVAKVQEELAELTDAIRSGEPTHIQWELGDLLFAIVNLGRFLEINSEDALRETINRFANRFRHIEKVLLARGVELRDASLEEMGALWEDAKLREKA